MKTTAVILILTCLCLARPDAVAQTGGDSAARLRAEHLRTILTIQDLRTPHDAALRELLYDRDTLVRQRATLAYGSLQDTTALQDLLQNLTDGPGPVQAAAAFAIGQTGPMLSAAGRADLAHELIWIRSDRMEDPGMLLEEVAKFGDEQALTDIMMKFADGRGRFRERLSMSIARFGIRGITTSAAVQYLLGDLKNESSVSWRAAYALQRIGKHDGITPEADALAGLVRSGDPLLRMNIAVLFGKLGPLNTLVEPLRRLADHDPDWRVRVNALKALGAFPPDDRTVETFRRAFGDRDLNVSITSITTFGTLSFPDSGGEESSRRALAEVERMARNAGGGYAWQLQAAAALALAKLEGEKSIPTIRPSGGEEPLLKAGLISAMGATGSPDVLGELMTFTDPGDPLPYRTALEAMAEIARANRARRGILDTVYAENLRGLKSGDMAVATVAAATMGDSLFLRPGSVVQLLEALGNMGAPADIEAMQEICRTLAKTGDRRAVPVLEGYLDSRDAALARAAAEALTDLTGEEYLDRIVTEREPLHVDLDFSYLESLPETVTVALETVFGDIRIELYKDLAPFTVMNILKLAEGEGYYNGLIFHRVVPNFVIQGGDPRGDGWGGPGFSIRSEFSPASYETGTVGIASAGKDTEGSQFFITHSPQPHLDGRYTIIGRVVSGMQVVNRIQVGDGIQGFNRIR